jgi:lipooligosaccharide transport system permease protein
MTTTTGTPPTVPTPTTPANDRVDLAARVPALREFGYWWHRYKRLWRGSVVISIVNPLLFLAAMGAGLGKLVNANHADALHGVPYLHFLAPGLMAASAMQNGYIESAGPVFQSAGRRGNYVAAAGTPMRPGDILAGHQLFTAFRVLMSGVLFTAVLLCFGVTGPGTALLLPWPVLLTGMAFACPVAAMSIRVRRPSRLNGVYRFVLMPLYMFSGTFFPIAQLPGWLRAFARWTPLCQGVDLTRSVALGSAAPGATTIHVGYLLALVVAGLLLARRGYTRRLHG